MEEDLKQWIKEISTKRPELSGFAICPFAEGASYEIINSKISGVAPIEGCDVAIFVVEDHLTSEELRLWREKLNDTYPEYEFLEDGMDESTFLLGFQTNFGKANLMMCQKRDHLNKMRAILEKTDYYSMWDPEVLNKIKGQGEKMTEDNKKFLQEVVGEGKHDLKKQTLLHEEIRNDEDYDDWEYGTEPSYGKDYK